MDDSYEDDESTKVKEKIIKKLSIAIGKLENDFDERDKWLKSESSKPPQLTRTYNSRSIMKISDLENSVKPSEPRMTNVLKAEIQNVEAEFDEKKLLVETDMRKRYAKDLVKSPYYVGLSSKELMTAEKEFEKRLAKELKRVDNEKNAAIEDLKAYHRNLNAKSDKKTKISVRATNNRRKESKRVAKLRENQRIEMQEFEEEIEAYKAREDRLFKKKYGSDDLEALRINQEQIDREVNRRNIAFNRKLTLDLHMTEGKYLEKILNTDPTLSRHKFEKFMNIYLKDIDSRKLFKKPTFSWDEGKLLIDVEFTRRLGWAEFVSDACIIWANAGDIETRGEMDKMMRRYALLVLDGYFEDNENPYDDIDIKISSLKKQKDSLLSKICVQDRIIEERLNKIEKEKSLENERLLNTKKERQNTKLKTAKLDTKSNIIEKLAKEEGGLIDKALLIKLSMYEDDTDKEEKKALQKKIMKEDTELDKFYDRYT